MLPIDGRIEEAKCEDLENVLLLMKVSFVNMFFCCIKALYFPLVIFISD